MFITILVAENKCHHCPIAEESGAHHAHFAHVSAGAGADMVPRSRRSSRGRTAPPLVVLPRFAATASSSSAAASASATDDSEPHHHHHRRLRPSDPLLLRRRPAVVGNSTRLSTGTVNATTAAATVTTATAVATAATAAAAAVVENKLSRRELALAQKVVLSREVRERGKAAAAAVSARLCGQAADRDGRILRARKLEKLRAARQRAARPENIYGNAVKEANLRRVVKAAGTSRIKRRTCLPLR